MTNKIMITADWPAPANVKAFSTLRQSQVGVRQTPYEIRKAGDIDRRLLVEKFQLPETPIWVNQTHTNIVHKALPENDSKEGDAVYTDEKNRVCAVLTADCLPVLICDREGQKVAAVHAGWKGLAKGIIEATLDKLQIPVEDTLIWLGPAIGPQKFEVRQDVFDIFTLADEEAKAAFQKINEEQWLGNIYQLARLRLAHRGIKNIYGGQYCTYSDREDFYSYRRDGRIEGSIANVIWLV